MVRFQLVFAGLAIGLMSNAALADTRAGVQMWEKGDFFGAVREWRATAIAGDPEAQYNLAQAYKLGRGVPLDLKMAESWYAKAAKQGHQPSRDNYGLMLFQNGDRASALPYIQDAAARGEPRAQYVLGTALFNGDGVGKDWVRAYALMTRASAAGIAAASTSLAQMDKFIPLDQRQRGLSLARTLETGGPAKLAGTMIGDTPPPRPSVQSEDMPASGVGAPPVPAARPPVTATRPPVRVTQAPTPRPRPTPLPTPVAASPVPAATAATAAGGKWRVQLGAFSDAAKANAFARSIGARPALRGYSVNAVSSGAIVRVQAGPLPSRAAASKLCAAVGSACLPIAP